MVCLVPEQDAVDADETLVVTDSVHPPIAANRMCQVGCVRPLSLAYPLRRGSSCRVCGTPHPSAFQPVPETPLPDRCVCLPHPQKYEADGETLGRDSGDGALLPQRPGHLERERTTDSSDPEARRSAETIYHSQVAGVVESMCCAQSGRPVRQYL